jgi:hypothetical protein
MSYVCTKVNSVSSELAKAFWDAGTDYYLTEGTLPKHSNTSPHEAYSIRELSDTTNREHSCVYQVAKDNYPVVLIPAIDDGDNLISHMIFIRPDSTNSKAFIYDENGMWYSFVNFWKEEGYTKLHGPVISEKTMFNYMKASCENNLAPCTWSSSVYMQEFWEETWPGNPSLHWIAMTFNE